MPVIALLIVIIVILLGGAGLIFGLVWAIFVSAWAVLPWVAGAAAIMFAIAFLKGVLNGVGASRPHARAGRAAELGRLLGTSSRPSPRAKAKAYETWRSLDQRMIDRFSRTALKEAHQALRLGQTKRMLAVYESECARIRERQGDRV